MASFIRLISELDAPSDMRCMLKTDGALPPLVCGKIYADEATPMSLALDMLLALPASLFDSLERPS